MALEYWNFNLLVEIHQLGNGAKAEGRFRSCYTKSSKIPTTTQASNFLAVASGSPPMAGTYQCFQEGK